MLNRPIVQVTYPRYVNGKKDLKLEPEFNFHHSGTSGKEQPVYVHYNGINHYNVFVPSTYEDSHKPLATGIKDLPDF